jgi:hypothetical protein
MIMFPNGKSLSLLPPVQIEINIVLLSAEGVSHMIAETHMESVVKVILLHAALAGSDILL